MIKKALIATTLTLAAASAQAELVEYDWETQGDGAVTLDTKTGNIWLDLKMTANMSINEVKSLVQNDARFAGWRMPTVDEIETLSANIFGTTPGTNYASTNITPSGLSAQTVEKMKEEHLSIGYARYDTYMYGIYEKNSVSYLFGSGVNGVFLNYRRADSLDWNGSYDGVYLVSTDYNTSYDAVSINERMGASDVSAPMALGAFGILLGLAGMRLRKSS